jgi:hypothetical protein
VVVQAPDNKANGTNAVAFCQLFSFWAIVGLSRFVGF